MKILLLPIAVIMLLFCGCNDSRRYEISNAGANNGGVYPCVIDTYTGKVWICGSSNKSNPDSNWHYLGNPTGVTK